MKWMLYVRFTSFGDPESYCKGGGCPSLVEKVANLVFPPPLLAVPPLPPTTTTAQSIPKVTSPPLPRPSADDVLRCFTICVSESETISVHFLGHEIIDNCFHEHVTLKKVSAIDSFFRSTFFMLENSLAAGNSNSGSSNDLLMTSRTSLSMKAPTGSVPCRFMFFHFGCNEDDEPEPSPLSISPSSSSQRHPEECRRRPPPSSSSSLDDDLNRPAAPPSSNRSSRLRNQDDDVVQVHVAAFNQHPLSVAGGKKATEIDRPVFLQLRRSKMETQPTICTLLQDSVVQCQQRKHGSHLETVRDGHQHHFEIKFISPLESFDPWDRTCPLLNYTLLKSLYLSQEVLPSLAASRPSPPSPLLYSPPATVLSAVAIRTAYVAPCSSGTKKGNRVVHLQEMQQAEGIAAVLLKFLSKLQIGHW